MKPLIYAILVKVIKIMLDQIEQLIRDISSLQKKFYSILDNNEIKPSINYSKVEVRHIMDDKIDVSKRFFSYLPKYLEQLNLFTLESIAILEEKYHFVRLRSRVKSNGSISQKLTQYLNKDDSGKFPIQKCLNDLCGFRISIDLQIFETEEFLSLMDKLKKEGIIFRHYYRQDGSYKAYHLYLKNKSNLFLPWELQIWYNEDEESNYSSHAEHKQGYINRERGENIV